MAQRFPSSGLGWADQFQALAYQALVEP
jgi:hypothetical protein